MSLCCRRRAFKGGSEVSQGLEAELSIIAHFALGPWMLGTYEVSGSI